MSAQIIDEAYDARMQHALTRRYYGQSDYFNFGYWADGANDPGAASERLVERLLASIPVKQGAALDVACGLGATTRALARHYGPEAVVGINISQAQLRSCAAIAPELPFARMDAAHLAFADQRFDAVLCVEAAFHFNTREQFLREAWRVLRPGGWLVWSDLLVQPWAVRLNRRVPPANFLAGPEDLGDLCRQIGFVEVQVEDVTEVSWRAFYRHSQRWRWQRFRGGELSAPDVAGQLLRNYIADRGLACYLQVAARRP